MTQPPLLPVPDLPTPWPAPAMPPMPAMPPVPARPAMPAMPEMPKQPVQPTNFPPMPERIPGDPGAAD
jgi:hypothetical protein